MNAAKLSVFDEQSLRKEFESRGINLRCIPAIWRYVVANESADPCDVPGLSAAAYDVLRSKFKAMTTTLSSAVQSIDQITTKLLVRLQVGCKMGCNFCATGSMGFKSNLSAAEIVEQLVHAVRKLPVRNIVFMGMGEPLNNYKSVVEAVRSFTGPCFQLAPRHITISTVGVIHGINNLKNDLPNINLAVSLHAPLQDIRCKIMPAARAFPLPKLMDALFSYQEQCKRTIFIEYIMLDGVNDQEAHAHLLGELLQRYEVVINLIPFNPIGTVSNYNTSKKETVETFQKLLRGQYNIRTTVRKEFGRDISGACGQLVIDLLDNKIHSKSEYTGSLQDIPDIEDLSVGRK